MAPEQTAEAAAPLTIEQTMAQLALSRAQVYHMVGAGKLTATKVDHRLHFAVSDVARVAADLAAAKDGLLAEASVAVDAFEAIVDDAADADQAAAGPEGAAEPPPPDIGTLITDLGTRLLAEAVRDGVEAIYVDPMVDGDRLLFSGAGRRRERARWSAELSTKVKEWLRAQASPTVRHGIAEGTGRVEAPMGTRQLILTSVPTRMGEHVHVRLIAEPPPTELLSLGYEAEQAQIVSRWLSSGSGLLLIADAADAWSQEHRQRLAQQLVETGRLVASVEHRLQYRSPYLIQFDVDGAEEAPDFAQLWRSLLTMDPDVILVDEVRSEEEARLVVDAAGGALVIAQVMAGNAVAALRRFLADGILPEAVNAHLIGAVERRTVRRLCPECRQSTGDSLSPFTAPGCDACDGGDAGHRAVVGVVAGADLSAWLQQETTGTEGGELGVTAALQRAVAAGAVYAPGY